MKLAPKIGIALVLIFVAYGVHGYYREGIAKRQSEEFWASVKIGTAVDDLLDRAKNAGADPRFTKWIAIPNEPSWLPATFVGLPPFSRHICSIKATTVVVSADYLYMD